MTLQAYDPNKLDQFALRLLDLAAVVRQMANHGRQYGVDDLPLHDKKAIEWCAKLEHWAHKTQADLEVRILHDRAGRQGRQPNGAAAPGQEPAPDQPSVGARR